MSVQLQWQVEACEFAEAKPYASRAAREHVKVDCPADTWYFCVRSGSELMGFSALMVRNGSARFKGDYTRPEYRRQGIASALMAARLAECERLGVKRMTAFCTSLSLPLYQANGFQPVKANARGITFVQKGATKTA